MARRNDEAEATQAEHEDVAAVLAKLPPGGKTDVAIRMVEVYESVERQYREASSAGSSPGGASNTSNR